MQHEYAKGSPLLNTDLEVIGIYVTKTGSSSEESCGEDNAYFVSLSSHIDKLEGWFNEVDRGIAILPCKDNETISFDIDVPLEKNANVRIIGSSVIQNVAVIFRAGTEIILEPGFDSGEDFLAEIGPCQDEITSLPRGLNNIISENESYTTDQKSSIKENREEAKAYPTILIDNQVTVETEGLSSLQVILTDLQGKVHLSKELKSLTDFNSFTLDLPNLSPGMYLLNLSNTGYFKTIKLIQQ
jgi:hypothetical protein